MSTGFFPHDFADYMLDKSRIMEETFIDRMDRRLKEVGLTDRAASLTATGKPDTIRDIRRRGTRPRTDTVTALAEVLETTVEYLLHGRQTGAALADRRTGYEAADNDLTIAGPRTIPVYGTALGAEMRFDEQDFIESHIVEMTDVIDWVRRPPAMNGRADVYSVYISGSSMEPRYESGDPVIVDPKRPPRPGDDVIVQIADDSDPSIVRAALIKRLVRRTTKALHLKQYNPAMEFDVPVNRVIAVHRVIPYRDIIG